MKKMIRTLVEFEAEAARFASSLARRESGATLITLSGELGAGKTSFAKVIARSLGVVETVNSPTFVLEKIYLLSAGKHFKRLIHIDAYRLSKGSELEALGFDELMRDASNIVLLEWPEKVADVLPAPTVHISLTVLSDGSRTILYG
ncbi:MAG: tRNA (adenosine(37)-N6)-threonylcarbamoyltransferase complex ATPase subunit type 1 TsaE [Minisyncoccota bacterium]